MKLLFDTHFLIAISRRSLPTLYPFVQKLVEDEQNACSISTCSLWEIAIKVRLGKLDIDVELGALPQVFELGGFNVIDINRHHAVADIDREPETRDPFDRLLLAQCKVEGLQLVTIDRALIDHPLAWRPGVS